MKNLVILRIKKSAKNKEIVFLGVREPVMKNKEKREKTIFLAADYDKKRYLKGETNEKGDFILTLTEERA